MLYSLLTPDELVSAGAVFPVLCGMLTGLRLYARRIQRSQWGRGLARSTGIGQLL